jgi:hypothetical protein
MPTICASNVGICLQGSKEIDQPLRVSWRRILREEDEILSPSVRCCEVARFPMPKLLWWNLQDVNIEGTQNL